MGGNVPACATSRDSPEAVVVAIQLSCSPSARLVLSNVRYAPREVKTVGWPSASRQSAIACDHERGVPWPTDQDGAASRGRPRASAGDAGVYEIEHALYRRVERATSRGAQVRLRKPRLARQRGMASGRLRHLAWR